jgi:hypothetical protein
MIWKLLIWLLLSFLFGKGLNLLFSPAEVFYSAALFIFPFILFGIQERYYTERTIFDFFGFTFFTKDIHYKKLTLWGIFPLSKKEKVKTQISIFRKLTPLAYKSNIKSSIALAGAGTASAVSATTAVALSAAPTATGGAAITSGLAALGFGGGMMTGIGVVAIGSGLIFTGIYKGIKSLINK